MKTVLSQSTETFLQTSPQDSMIVIEAGAQLDHMIIGNCNELTVHVKRDSLYSPFMLTSNEVDQTIHLTIHLDEPGAEVDLKGLLRGSEEQSINNTVTIYHHAEHTSSNQYLKSLADAQASISIVSDVKIEQPAKQASANQLTKSLLLSEEAEILAKPILEVDQDDVQASHGASIGALDPEAVFFLQSRGISQHDAETILLQAFTNELVEQIEDKSLFSHSNISYE